MAEWQLATLRPIFRVNDKILQYLAMIGPYMIILISYWPGGRAGHLPDQHHGPALALHQVADRVLYCTVLYCTVLYFTVLYCTVLYCTVLCCAVGGPG